MDVTGILPYWEGEKRVYHHTGPINMLYALYQALLLVFEEGPEAVWERHSRMHRRLIEGLGSLGLEPLVAAADQLPMLTAVKVPSGVDEAMVRRRLRTEHLIEIGAGLGPPAGKIWRVGLMGHTAREESVDRLVGALKAVLGR